MKKIRIALIGAGNIANTHLDAYRTLPNVEIAAICDIDEARLTTTADKYGIANRYTDVASMLAAELAEFVAAIESGNTDTANVEDGIAVMQILDAIYESAATGHEVTIN